MVDRKTIAEIIRRDAETSRPVWFDGPASFTALAARDRAVLIEELRESRRFLIEALWVPAPPELPAQFNSDWRDKVVRFFERTTDLT